MLTIKMSDLLLINRKDLHKNLKGKFNVIFEDRTLVMNSASIVLSRYIMIVLEEYKELNIPILSSFTVTANMKNIYSFDNCVNDAFSKILEYVAKTIISGNKNKIINLDELDKLKAVIFTVNNIIYSELSFMLTKHMSSINITHMIEFQKDKELQERMTDVKLRPTYGKIEDTYKYIDRLMYRKEFDENPFCRAFRASLVKEGQAKQLTGPKGVSTEVDMSIFRIPIVDSYLMGLSDSGQMVRELQSAAKALTIANEEISTADTSSRLLSVICQSFCDKLEYYDCGTTDYREVTIRSEVVTDTRNSPSELSRYLGTYYLDETDGMEKVIDSNFDKMDKKIQIRSVSRCKCDSDKVCVKCYGDLYLAIGKGSNVGHFSVILIWIIIQQGMLSTKHKTDNALTLSIKETEELTKYFDVNKNTLKFNYKGNKNNKVIMVIPYDDCYNIMDVTLQNLNSIDNDRLANIYNITLIEMDNRGNVLNKDTITIGNGARYGILTLGFLKHICKEGIHLNEKGDYTIDMTKWKYKTPIINIKSIDFNFSEIGKEADTILRKIGKGYTVDKLSEKLFTILGGKINVPYIYIDVLSYCFTSQDKQLKDYRLYRDGKNTLVTGKQELISGRSLSTLYPSNSIGNAVTSPLTFFYEGRMNSPFDGLICPRDVYNKKYKKR